MDQENTTMMLIVNAGNARSLAMEAIQRAKGGDSNGAEEKLNESSKAIALAHEQQTELLSASFENPVLKVDMLTIHAQDHLMGAISTLELAREFCDMYRMLFEMNGEGK